MKIVNNKDLTAKIQERKAKLALAAKKLEAAKKKEGERK